MNQVVGVVGWMAPVVEWEGGGVGALHNALHTVLLTPLPAESRA